MINTLFSVTKYMSHIVLNKIVRMSSNATLDKATPMDRFSVSNPIIKLEWAPFYNLVSCSILRVCITSTKYTVSLESMWAMVPETKVPNICSFDLFDQAIF